MVNPESQFHDYFCSVSSPLQTVDELPFTQLNCVIVLQQGMGVDHNPALSGLDLGNVMSTVKRSIHRLQKEVGCIRNVVVVFSDLIQPRLGVVMDDRAK